MSSLALLDSLRQAIAGQASVKAVFGEPIAAAGKTIIPVARIAYGFGAGSGTGGMGSSAAQGEGGGGGGGIRATAAGVIEVSERTTRFIAIGDRRKLAAAALAGALAGWWLARRVGN